MRTYDAVSQASNPTRHTAGTLIEASYLCRAADRGGRQTCTRSVGRAHLARLRQGTRVSMHWSSACEALIRGELTRL